MSENLYYLVLEVYGGVEVWNLDIGGFAHHLSFGWVQEGAEFENGGWRARWGISAST